MKLRPDYQPKQFRNPFFGHRQRQPTKRRSRAVWVVLVIVPIMALLLFGRSQVFQINNVEVRGEPVVGKQEIAGVIEQQLGQRRWAVFSQRNIFFFDTDAATRLLDHSFGARYLRVSKKYFKTVIVSVTEDVSLLAWSANQKTYYLDGSGVALREAAPASAVTEAGREGTEVVRTGSQLGSEPLIFDESNAEVNVGTSVATPALISFITTIAKLLKDQPDFEVARYSLVSPYADQLTMQTTAGWQVYFKTTDSPTSQVNRLLIVLEQKIKDRSKLEYIDLRYGDKVFYK